ncbi:MAG: phosphonate ABC transporter, permease protein PhnE [Spirochaetales bacterium]|nr:phosphonate ABC transporter, permease protein PhnE [Spirochaetales bacterium]
MKFTGLKPANLFSTDPVKPETFFRAQKLKFTLVFLMLAVLVFLASHITRFNFFRAFTAVPKVIIWMFKNLIPNRKALEKLPRILDKLADTMLMAVMATVSASVFSLLFALLGSKTTRPNKAFAFICRIVASVNRNIPVAAWAMIFLLAFGQSSFTGFLALFFATFGFLTRAFMETIDEASSDPVKALRAVGANEIQIIFQAVLPSCLPQMLSWILYLVEMNIRSATLVGLLTGSGIGFMFSIYYKSLQYSSASLVVLCVVIVVLAIELISNALRRVIL